MSSPTTLWPVICAMYEKITASLAEARARSRALAAVSLSRFSASSRLHASSLSSLSRSIFSTASRSSLWKPSRCLTNCLVSPLKNPLMDLRPTLVFLFLFLFGALLPGDAASFASRVELSEAWAPPVRRFASTFGCCVQLEGFGREASVGGYWLVRAEGGLILTGLADPCKATNRLKLKLKLQTFYCQFLSPQVFDFDDCNVRCCRSAVHCRVASFIHKIRHHRCQNVLP